MSFENPIFLLALGAVAVPILIHLIYRLRKRVVTFGSLRFLRAVVRRNRRRLRLRDALLLALRCAAVALIALGFARPRAATRPQAESARRDVVFVLDDSFSMSASPGARTLFEEAKSRILARLGSLAPPDRAGLVAVTGGGRIVSPLSSDLDAVARAVRGVSQSCAGGELAGAIRAAAGLLASSDAPARIVALASDLQRNSWTAGSLAALGPLAADCELLLEPAENPNLAVLGVEQAGESWSVGEPVRVRARVANFGPAERKGIGVLLRVGAERRARASVTVDLAPWGESVAELAYLATCGGEFPAAVEITGRDALAADDVRHAVLRLRDRVRILCVQDELLGGKSRYLDESYFVRMALDPAPGGAGPGESPFAAEAVESRSVDAASLREPGAVFLLGANLLSDAALEEIAVLARAGTGLFLAPPGQAGGGDWRLPGRLERLGLAPARVGRVIDYPEGIALSAGDASHPIWKAFAGGSTAEGGSSRPLPRFAARRLYELEPLEGSVVLATFENGRPAAVAREMGRARVLQLAFSLRPESSELPKRKAFVPFVHGAAAWLARSPEREPPAAVEAGSAVPPSGLLAGLSEGTRTELVDPDGSTVALGGLAQIVADRLGIYTFRLPRSDERARRGGGSAVEPGVRLIAVNPPAAESDLRRGSREEFLAALRAGRGEAVAPTEVPPARDPGRASRLWAVLIALAGGMMLAETLLANRALLGAQGAPERPEDRAPRTEIGAP